MKIRYASETGFVRFRQILPNDRAFHWHVFALAAYATLLISCNPAPQVTISPQSISSATRQEPAPTLEPTISSKSPVDADNEALSSIREQNSCPITPIQDNFWDYVGPVAGEYPVWMTSIGQSSWSDFGPWVLPPESGGMAFDIGHTTKLLLFVDKEIQGNLLVSGKQLDGDGIVYFPTDMERVNDTTLQLQSIPPDFLILEDAHISTHFPEPPGKSHRGWGAMFPNPGCYEFKFEIEEYSVAVVLEILDK